MLMFELYFVHTLLIPHLSPLHTLCYRRYDDLGWKSSEVSAAQMMLRGKSGIGVRRLSDKSVDEQEKTKWSVCLSYTYMCMSLLKTIYTFVF